MPRKGDDVESNGSIPTKGPPLTGRAIFYTYNLTDRFTIP